MIIRFHLVFYNTNFIVPARRRALQKFLVAYIISKQNKTKYLKLWQYMIQGLLREAFIKKKKFNKCYIWVGPSATFEQL